jgi:hypothetical protein
MEFFRNWIDGIKPHSHKTLQDKLIFISYAHEDWSVVEVLYKNLKSEGLNPWMDKFDLLPGQDWDLEIRKVISRADYFVACLSKKAFSKRGYVQKEFKFGLDTLQEIPEGQIYLIPVRLDDCDVPESLKQRHWVDLFEKDGYKKLLKVFQTQTDDSAFIQSFVGLDDTTFLNAKSVELSGITLSSTIVQYYDVIRHCLEKNKSRIRIMLLDAENEHNINQLVQKSWSNKVSEEYYKLRLRNSYELVEHIGSSVSPTVEHGTLQLGLLPFVPSFGVFLFDFTSPKGKAFVEIYHHLSVQPSPKFELSIMKDEFSYKLFGEQFELMWNTCKIRKIL